MKKVSILFLMIVCSLLAKPANLNNESNNETQDDWADIIELSRLGGTTRAARQGVFSMQSIAVEPIVEASFSKNVFQVFVQNYRGPVWVEIYGAKGAKHSSFEVFDIGFEVIKLSGLGAGEYNVRITVGSNVFTGKLKKGQNGKK